MPITLDLSHDPLFASFLERGRLKGEKEGRKEGLLLGQRKGIQKGVQQGRAEGVRQVVHLLLEKRFGRLPAPIVKRMAELTDAQARKLALQIIDAKSLKQLFGNSTPRRSRV
jgi:predicted transposase YdaD